METYPITDLENILKTIINNQDEVLEILKEIKGKVDISFWAKLDSSKNLVKSAILSKNKKIAKQLLVSALTSAEEAMGYFKRSIDNLKIDVPFSESFLKGFVWIFTRNLITESPESKVMRLKLEKMNYLYGYVVAFIVRNKCATLLEIKPKKFKKAEQYFYDVVFEEFDNYISSDTFGNLASLYRKNGNYDSIYGLKVFITKLYKNKKLKKSFEWPFLTYDKDLNLKHFLKKMDNATHKESWLLDDFRERSLQLAAFRIIAQISVLMESI